MPTIWPIGLMEKALVADSMASRAMNSAFPDLFAEPVTAGLI